MVGRTWLGQLWAHRGRWPLAGAPCLGFAGSLQRAGSRPGGRPTFCCARKLDKEALFQTERTTPSAFPGPGAAPRLSGSNMAAPDDRSRFSGGSAQQVAGTHRSPHATIARGRGLRVTALTEVARPWNVPRCFRPALFEPDRRGAAPGPQQALGVVRSVWKSASLSNFLAQQKVGRPPGRDPARCTASAKNQQGAQAKEPMTDKSPKQKLSSGDCCAPPGRPASADGCQWQVRPACPGRQSGRRRPPAGRPRHLAAAGRSAPRHAAGVRR